MAVLLALGVGASRAWGLTADGALITNLTCATFESEGGIEYAVTYCATAAVLVASPAIGVRKAANPSIGCAGNTVTFCVYAANNSAYASAFNVMLEDVVPPELFYLRGQTYWAGTTAGVTIRFGWRVGAIYCWDNIGGAPCSAQTEPPVGQDSAGGLLGVRWAISVLGPGKSALVCWQATIR